MSGIPAIKKIFSVSPEIRVNLILYAAFLLLACAGIVYGHAIWNDHALLRVWGYQDVFLLGLGIPFLFLQAPGGLPNFWEKDIPARQRLLRPALTGAVFGLLDVLVIKFILHPEPYPELPPFLQPFPYSCFLYFSGALEIEVFYRLIPLTLILLMGKWYSNGKYFNSFFWTGAVLTSLREPLEQLPTGSPGFIVYAVSTGLLMNFMQAIHYRKSGFLAALSVRLGHYVIWHILLGIYVEFVELS